MFLSNLTQIHIQRILSQAMLTFASLQCLFVYIYYTPVCLNVFAYTTYIIYTIKLWKTCALKFTIEREWE